MKITNNCRENIAIRMVQTLPAPGKDNITPSSGVKSPIEGEISQLTSRKGESHDFSLSFPLFSTGKKPVRAIKIALTDLQYHYYCAKALAQNTTLEKEIAAYLYQRFPLDR